jgi:hypothetical protein
MSMAKRAASLSRDIRRSATPLPPLTRRVPLPNGDTLLMVDREAFRRGIAAAGKVLADAWEKLREREQAAAGHDAPTPEL